MSEPAPDGDDGEWMAFLAALARHQRSITDPLDPELTPALALEWLRDDTSTLSPANRRAIAKALDLPDIRVRGRPASERLRRRQTQAALLVLILESSGDQMKSAVGRVAALLGQSERTVRRAMADERERLGAQGWTELARDAATLLAGYRRLEATGEAEGQPLRELPLIRALLRGQ